jgi:hypothetical protein
MLVQLHWRKVLGLALALLLLMPILGQVSAAPRDAVQAGKTVAADEGSNVSNTLGKNEDDGGGKDPPCVPDGEGDPDDYGYMPPWLARVLFYLQLIR